MSRFDETKIALMFVAVVCLWKPIGWYFKFLKVLEKSLHIATVAVAKLLKIVILFDFFGVWILISYVGNRLH